jgi:hypothetical protein
MNSRLVQIFGTCRFAQYGKFSACPAPPCPTVAVIKHHKHKRLSARQPLKCQSAGPQPPPSDGFLQLDFAKVATNFNLQIIFPAICILRREGYLPRGALAILMQRLCHIRNISMSHPVPITPSHYRIIQDETLCYSLS